MKQTPHNPRNQLRLRLIKIKFILILLANLVLALSWRGCTVTFNGVDLFNGTYTNSCGGDAWAGSYYTFEHWNSFTSSEDLWVQRRFIKEEIQTTFNSTDTFYSGGFHAPRYVITCRDQSVDAPRNYGCEDTLKANVTTAKRIYCTPLFVAMFGNRTGCNSNMLADYVATVESVQQYRADGKTGTRVSAANAGIGYLYLDLNYTELVSLTQESSGSSVYVEVDQEMEKVIITFSLKLNRTILITSTSGYSDMFKTEESSFMSKLEPSVWARNGYITIKIYEGALLVYTSQNEIVGRNYCKMFNCIFCRQTFSNFECQPLVYKIAFIVVFSLLCLLTVCLFPCFVVCFDLIFRCFGCVVTTPKSLVQRLVESRLFSRFRKKSNSVEMEEKEKLIDKATVKIEMPRRTEIGQKASKRQGKSRKVGSIEACLLILCIVSANACDVDNIVTGTFSDCVNTGTEKLCNAEMDTRLVMTNIGMTTCFTLVDSDNDAILKDQLTYSEVGFFFSPSAQYKVFDYKCVCDSVVRCRGNGDSFGEVQCKATQEGESVSAYGELTDGLTASYPGITECSEVCGCAACGCFECANSFNPRRGAIVPSGGFYLVYDLSDMTPYLQVTTNTTYNGINSVNVQTLYNQVSNSPIKFEVTGLDLLTPPEINSRCLVRDITGDYITVCNSVNELVYGNIGDVQLSPNGTFIASRTSFSFAPEILKTQASDSINTYYCDYSSLARLRSDSSKRLPIIEGDWWYGMVSGVFTAKFLGGYAPLTIDITTPGNWSVNVEQDLVCPKIIDIRSVTGCYACDMGASLLLDIKSTCLGGIVLLDLYDPDDCGVELVTNSLSINTTQTTQHVYFQSQCKSGGFKFIINANGGNVSQVVSYTLISQNDVIVGPNSQTDSNDHLGRHDTHGLGFVHFFTKWLPGFVDDIFKGLASWWEYLLFVLISLVVFIVVVALCYYSLKLLLKRRMTKAEKAV